MQIEFKHMPRRQIDRIHRHEYFAVKCRPQFRGHCLSIPHIADPSESPPPLNGIANDTRINRAKDISVSPPPASLRSNTDHRAWETPTLPAGAALPARC